MDDDGNLGFGLNESGLGFKEGEDEEAEGISCGNAIFFFVPFFSFFQFEIK